MRFLFCCQFYYPSVGGVQEVMRQIAERLAQRGHQVTVATGQLDGDAPAEHNGVNIERFGVAGNAVQGMRGEIERYRAFVANFPCDAILIKAAQQWTFDALFPIIDRIKPRKFFIPCGFSGLYRRAYKNYFAQLPDILRRFDGLIFYADPYRDVDFCRARGLEKLVFVPNGADENEFADATATPGFRQRLGIAEDSFVFSTVGSFSGVKGHRKVAEAFARMPGGGRKLTLVLNGNWPIPRDPLRRIAAALRRRGIDRAIRCARADPFKQVLVTDLPRADVVDLFKASDLFVFASNIEYAPLVLFEAAAAGTPFLSVPVGNAEEIAALTGGGVICPAPKDTEGYTRADPAALAKAMAALMDDPARLEALGQAGRRNWREQFTWDKIAARYEALLTGAPPAPAVAAPAVSVLLPVYNNAATLVSAVGSVLTQTLTDFELILIDDGSTDDALEAIRELGDPRLRIIGDAARLGLAARLNQGIDAARGAFIARMDGDDLSFPDRLQKQMQFLKNHPAIDLVGCRAVVFRDGGGIVGLLPYAPTHVEICARPWRGIPLPHPTWMGRADWFRRFRYALPEIHRAEDQELLLRSCPDSRFACLDDILLGYRQGRFKLGKTLTARRQLLKAQLRIFIARRQWGYALLNLAATLAKAGIDLLAALPGCEKLFFARMKGRVPDQAVRDLDRARGQT